MSRAPFLSPQGKRLERAMDDIAKRAAANRAYQLKQQAAKHKNPGLLRGLQQFAQAPMGASFGSLRGAFGSIASDRAKEWDAGSLVIGRDDADDAIPYSAAVQNDIDHSLDAVASTQGSNAASGVAVLTPNQAAAQANASLVALKAEPFLRVSNLVGLAAAGAAYFAGFRKVTAGVLVANMLDIALRKSVDSYRLTMSQQPWNTKVL